MSYNNNLVSIGGNPYSYSRSSGNNIDTSNLLNTSHANHLFVNESGDSMSGILDMKTNKIINLGIPNRNDDASNKFYVDNSIVQATKNYGVLIKELDNLGKTNEVLRSNITNLKNETELKIAKLNEGMKILRILIECISRSSAKQTIKLNKQMKL